MSNDVVAGLSKNVTSPLHDYYYSGNLHINKVIKENSMIQHSIWLKNMKMLLLMIM